MTRIAGDSGSACPTPFVAKAAELMVRADEHCPHSNATRGNIPVTLSVDGTPIQRAAA